MRRLDRQRGHCSARDNEFCVEFDGQGVAEDVQLGAFISVELGDVALEFCEKD